MIQTEIEEKKPRKSLKDILPRLNQNLGNKVTCAFSADDQID